MPLRRTENVTLHFKPHWLTGRGRLTVRIGRKSYRLGRVPKAHMAGVQAAQWDFPQLVIGVGDRTYWQFAGHFWWDNDGLSAEQVHALLAARVARQAARLERAEAMMASGGPRRARREHIPDDVKQLVWVRDGGCCRNCQATGDLQFDHVIPVALGGASGPGNLQILCGPCNRRKGAGLTVR